MYANLCVLLLMSFIYNCNKESVRIDMCYVPYFSKMPDCYANVKDYNPWEEIMTR